MADGMVKGYFVMGENPAVGSMHGALQRKGLRASRSGWWSATSPRPRPPSSGGRRRRSTAGRFGPRTSHTEVFFFPAAAHTEKDGSFTNTQRLLQWHHKAVEPPGDCRQRAALHVPPGPAAEGALRGLDRPEGPARSCDLTWDYPTTGAHAGAGRRGGAGGDQRLHASPTARPLVGLHGPEGRRQSTACGCWIYFGLLRKDGVNQTGPAQDPRRTDLGGPGVGLGLAGQPAHPLQPRLGRPRGQAVVGAQEVRLVGRDRQESGPASTSRTSSRTGRPPTARRRTPRATTRSRRHRPVHHAGATGRAWLFAPNGLLDGPLPTHYEPQESVVKNAAVRPAVQPGPHGVASEGQPLPPGVRATRASRSCSPPTGSPSTTPPAA